MLVIFLFESLLIAVFLDEVGIDVLFLEINTDDEESRF